MNEKLLTRETILSELGQLKPGLAKRYGVSRLGLFGSFARGEAREDSDIDVVIEMNDPDLFALVHIKEELEQDLRHPVDVIPLSPLMNSFLKARISIEAVYV
ncbi:MAG: nucleotidyltransferase [Spirochaetes bacterium]|nr:MAG: nucleotidyltransferase [Spirochaetota bacterium]